MPKERVLFNDITPTCMTLFSFLLFNIVTWVQLMFEHYFSPRYDSNLRFHEVSTVNK